MAFIPSQIMKQNISLATSSLFWSTAIIGAPFALYYIYGKVTLTIIFVNNGRDELENVNASLTWAILLFLLTLELMVAILRSKYSGLAVPRCVGYCCSFIFASVAFVAAVDQVVNHTLVLLVLFHCGLSWLCSS